MKEITHRDFNADRSAEDGHSKVHWTFFLGPIAGIIAMFAIIVSYQYLDQTLIYGIGAVPCLASYTVINVAWRRAKSREDVRMFFPYLTWLACGCLVVPAILFLNGALDHSPVERHQATITRTMLRYGRRGSISYSIEVPSWRAHHSYEKIGVSKTLYLDSGVGDPIIVETRKGALGIPLLVSVHMPE